MFSRQTRTLIERYRALKTAVAAAETKATEEAELMACETALNQLDPNIKAMAFAYLGETEKVNALVAASADRQEKLNLLRDAAYGYAAAGNQQAAELLLAIELPEAPEVILLEIQKAEEKLALSKAMVVGYVYGGHIEAAEAMVFNDIRTAYKNSALLPAYLKGLAMTNAKDELTTLYRFLVQQDDLEAEPGLAPSGGVIYYPAINPDIPHLNECITAVLEGLAEACNVTAVSKFFSCTLSTSFIPDPKPINSTENIITVINSYIKAGHFVVLVNLLKEYPHQAEYAIKRFFEAGRFEAGCQALLNAYPDLTNIGIRAIALQEGGVFAMRELSRFYSKAASIIRPIAAIKVQMALHQNTTDIIRACIDTTLSNAEINILFNNQTPEFKFLVELTRYGVERGFYNPAHIQKLDQNSVGTTYRDSPVVGRFFGTAACSQEAKYKAFVKLTNLVIDKDTGVLKDNFRAAIQPAELRDPAFEGHLGKLVKTLQSMATTPVDAAAVVPSTNKLGDVEMNSMSDPAQNTPSVSQ